MQVAGIYVRVSSDIQKEEHTIDSQIASLVEYALHEKYVVPQKGIMGMINRTVNSKLFTDWPHA